MTIIRKQSTFQLLEVCWLQGLRAHLAGNEETTNPYPLDSREHDYWSDGWWEACMNEGNVLNMLAE